MTEFWASLVWFLAGAVVAAIATFFITKGYFEKQLRENPPITEKQIRAMYSQMGRKPSEAQIRQIMNSMKQG